MAPNETRTRKGTNWMSLTILPCRSPLRAIPDPPKHRPCRLNSNTGSGRAGSQHHSEPQRSWQRIRAAGRETGQIRHGPAGTECAGRATLGAKIPLWLLEILQSQQTGILPEPTASARTHFYGKASDRFCSHTINNAPSPQGGWNAVLVKLIVLSWFVVAENLIQRVNISVGTFCL